MVIITVIVQDKHGCITADVNTYDGPEAMQSERDTATEITRIMTMGPDREVTDSGERKMDGAQAVRR